MSKEQLQKIEKQLEKSQATNTRILKLLSDISSYVANFVALREVVSKPEVAVDYNDLEYLEKLEFVEGVEPPLEYVTKLVHRAKDMLTELQTEYNSIEDKESAVQEINEISRKLRESEDLLTIEDQEAEVKATLQDLRERRKRFGDCNIAAQLNARRTLMTRIKALYEGTNTKFNENKTNIDGLLQLESTKPERRALLAKAKENELVEMEEKLAKFDPVWQNLTSQYA